MKIIKYFFAGISVLLLVVIVGAIIFLYPRFENNRSGKTEFVNESVVLENKLQIPPLATSRMENGEKVFDLTVQSGQMEFFKGKQTRTLGFNGSYLGPTIRANMNDKVRINVTNKLGEITTVHWHGMHLPPIMDGGPYQMIEPNQTWRPNWTVTNQASTLWYHPHQMGTTGEQVYQGLAGLFIIDDKNSQSLVIPKEYGVDDIPLVVQDREFNKNGQMNYSHSEMMGITSGMLGDTILVNGTRAPFIDAPAKLIRLRILNGSNARRYNFGFSDDRKFHQIASDGGLLEAPVERTRMLLAPGERAEILVDLTGMGQAITLLSYPVIDGGGSFQNTIHGMIMGRTDEGQQFKILEIRPTPGQYAGSQVPAVLNTIENLQPNAAMKTREFRLDTAVINGKKMSNSRVDAIIKKGDIEIWELENDSPIYHPIHIHGVQFQVLERDGQKPPVHESGWKDTVIVSPAERIRIIMQFKGYSDASVPYMFHCHILEHEDMGMMGQFVVVEDLSDEIKLAPLSNQESSGGHMMH